MRRSVKVDPEAEHPVEVQQRWAFSVHCAHSIGGQNIRQDIIGGTVGVTMEFVALRALS